MTNLDAHHLPRDYNYAPEELNKALNQLGSVLAGKELAIETNHLSASAFGRIETMEAEANGLLIQAAQGGDTKALNQAQRKVQSLASLLILADALRCAGLLSDL